jgi:hypothetical protein
VRAAALSEIVPGTAELPLVEYECGIKGLQDLRSQGAVCIVGAVLLRMQLQDAGVCCSVFMLVLCSVKPSTNLS